MASNDIHGQFYANAEVPMVPPNTSQILCEQMNFICARLENKSLENKKKPLWPRRKWFENRSLPVFKSTDQPNNGCHNSSNHNFTFVFLLLYGFLWNWLLHIIYVAPSHPTCWKIVIWKRFYFHLIATPFKFTCYQQCSAYGVRTRLGG